MKLTDLLGIELPIVQAPMAGAQDSAMAIAVSNAGGLGSLPCAMLTAEGLRSELETIRSQTKRPFNGNFFCHAAPVADVERESAWRAALMPYYKRYGIDPAGIPSGPARAPFSAEFADVQVGTAYLLCAEAAISAIDRAALKSEAALLTRELAAGL
jgi:nitronate monooxygenase